MNEHRWRVPKEEEKKYALYWVSSDKYERIHYGKNILKK